MSSDASRLVAAQGWKSGRVGVSRDGSLGLGGYTWVAEPAYGVVYVPDGGLFGHPGVSGWVTFRSGDVVQVCFAPGTAADPTRPPSPAVALPPAVQPPRVPPPSPTVHAPPKPAVADRVRIKDRTHTVAVSQHANGWLVKGTVDGRVFKATGHSEVLALAAWRSMVIRELDL